MFADDGETRVPGSTADPGMDAQFKTLADRVAKSADPDLKQFLVGILKATEATLTDLGNMRERLDKAQASAEAAAVTAQTAKKDAARNAIKADILAEAQAVGAVDAKDILPFVDLRNVIVGENGSSNVGQLLAELKVQKPYLFGKTSTSALHAAPKPGNASPRSALDMTTAEYRAARARFTRR